MSHTSSVETSSVNVAPTDFNGKSKPQSSQNDIKNKPPLKPIYPPKTTDVKHPQQNPKPDTHVNSNNNNVHTPHKPTTDQKNSSHTTTTTTSPTHKIPFGSRSVDMFEKLEQIGEGTYGEVWMAKNKETHEIVALKKIRMENEKEGFPITAIREIKILKELKHDNVVNLKEIVTAKATKDKPPKEISVYMVFEYMDHDLTGLMTNDANIWRPSEAHIKCYMKQLLEGLHYCHSKGVLHRDIKGSNLLINNQGQLQLADFGLARGYTGQQGHYTNKVITLWYRPPELLLGAVEYGPAIDIWSAGCIFAELLTKKPIFPGKNETDQLDLIWDTCGTPTDENWPSFVKLPYASWVPRARKVSRLRERFHGFKKETIDLLESMLTLDPSRRITAHKALDSDYFWNDPLPCEPSALPKFPTSHEYQTKKRRAAQQQNPDPTKKPKASGPPSDGNYGPSGPAYNGRSGPPRYPPGQQQPYQQQTGQYPPSRSHGHPSQDNRSNNGYHPNNHDRSYNGRPNNNVPHPR